jgi:small subunit ribosomal protein S1
VASKYKIGQAVEGKILKISPYGAFIELDNDIHGLAHISELTRKSINHPSEVLKVGESRNFKIISLEPGAHRLGLALASEDGVAQEPDSSDSPAKQESEAPTESV